MGIRSKRTDPSGAAGPVYRYGMLVFILGLLAWNIHWHLTLPPSYDGDPYSTSIIILTLLFNHLVAAFKWPRHVSVVLWALSWSWMAFTLFYVFYWGRVLYPLPCEI